MIPIRITVWLLGSWQGRSLTAPTPSSRGPAKSVVSAGCCVACVLAPLRVLLAAVLACLLALCTCLLWLGCALGLGTPLCRLPLRFYAGPAARQPHRETPPPRPITTGT
jgi:hypothetical protein